MRLDLDCSPGFRRAVEVQAYLEVAIFTILRDNSPLLTVDSEQPRLSAKNRTPSYGQILQFVKDIAVGPSEQGIVEFLVCGFEGLEPGAHTPVRRGFTAEYFT